MFIDRMVSQYSNCKILIPQSSLFYCHNECSVLQCEQNSLITDYYNFSVGMEKKPFIISSENVRFVFQMKNVRKQVTTNIKSKLKTIALEELVLDSGKVYFNIQGSFFGPATVPVSNYIFLFKAFFLNSGLRKILLF